MRHDEHARLAAQATALGLHGRIHGILHVGKRRHEAVAHLVGLHVRHQVHVAAQLYLRDGRRLVAAQAEVALQVVHHIPRRARLVHPLRKRVLAQSLRARAHQHYDAAVFHGVLRVVERLLQLVQVQVLRRAALAHHHDVRVLVKLAAVQRVQLAARVALRGHKVARGAVHHVLLLVEDHVHDEVEAHHGAGFLKVEADGALHVAGARGRVHHERVVCLDRGECGATGHDGLGAAGVAREVVVLHVAERDAHVRRRDLCQHVDRRAVRRGAHVRKPARVPVQHAQAPVVRAHDRTELVFRLRAMATQRDGQKHVLVAHAGGMELVHHGRQHRRRGKRPRHVARYHAHGLARAHQLAQTRRAYGRRKRGAHDLLARGAAHQGVRVHDLYDVFLRKLEALRARADANLVAHALPPRSRCRRRGAVPDATVLRRGSASPARGRAVTHA